MSRHTDLRDIRVWPEDRGRWLKSRRRRNDREIITEQSALYVPAAAEEMAPGVLAIAYPVNGDELRITWVSAVNPGSGEVGHWLDTLPLDQTIWVSAIVSDRLTGMLGRRGFSDAGSGNMVRRALGS